MKKKTVPSNNISVSQRNNDLSHIVYTITNIEQYYRAIFYRRIFNKATYSW